MKNWSGDDPIILLVFLNQSYFEFTPLEQTQLRDRELNVRIIRQENGKIIVLGFMTFMYNFNYCKKIFEIDYSITQLSFVNRFPSHCIYI